MLAELRRLLIAAETVLLITFPTLISAEKVQCGPYVSVSSQNTETAEQVCTASRRALALFESCGVPKILRPIQINVVHDLKEGCVALYHCGEDTIELLEPSEMQERRLPESAFSHLNIDEYFRSVVIHELTHAANDGLPCPFESCVVADEYVAYSMQVMSLDTKSRQKFIERSGIQDRVSSEELSAIILFMAPDLFAQKVWAHLNQRENACRYIDGLSSGKIVLDRGRF